MTDAGFLSSQDRKDLVVLAKNGSAVHRLVRRANALVLLDAGWTYARVAGALLVDDDTIRTWHDLFTSMDLTGWPVSGLGAAPPNSAPSSSKP